MAFVCKQTTASKTLDNNNDVLRIDYCDAWPIGKPPKIRIFMMIQGILKCIIYNQMAQVKSYLDL